MFFLFLRFLFYSGVNFLVIGVYSLDFSIIFILLVFKGPREQTLLQCLALVQQLQWLFGSYGDQVYALVGPTKIRRNWTTNPTGGLIRKQKYVVLFTCGWYRLNWKSNKDFAH